MMLIILNICLLVTVGLVKGDDVQLLTAASSDFSQKLYQKIALDTPNVVYSPYSIHSALTMTLFGAREETARQMSTALSLSSLPGHSPNVAYRDLNVQLNDATNVTLHTANALFVNPNISIDVQFERNAHENYFATTSNFDLAAVGGPEKEINDFVENKTEGLITNIVEPGKIDSLTVALLINTIFFNGTWERQFSEQKTRKQDFQQLAGAKTQVYMMNDVRTVNYKANVDGNDVAEIPFTDRRFSLYIALPQQLDGITTLESLLVVPGKVDQLFEGLTRTEVRLSVPKFKIESSLDLRSPLKDLGIINAFDPSRANFQGLSSVATVHISDVLHKALIEVKETGTVAAAVTAVVADIRSSLGSPTSTFNADHPFLFFLRDNQSKQILFQGKFSGQ